MIGLQAERIARADRAEQDLHHCRARLLESTQRESNACQVLAEVEHVKDVLSQRLQESHQRAQGLESELRRRGGEDEQRSKQAEELKVELSRARAGEASSRAIVQRCQGELESAVADLRGCQELLVSSVDLLDSLQSSQLEMVQLNGTVETLRFWKSTLRKEMLGGCQQVLSRSRELEMEERLPALLRQIGSMPAASAMQLNQQLESRLVGELVGLLEQLMQEVEEVRRENRAQVLQIKSSIECEKQLRRFMEQEARPAGQRGGGM
eukprot:76891-Hanusia_phi.AAC.1